MSQIAAYSDALAVIANPDMSHLWCLGNFEFCQELHVPIDPLRKPKIVDLNTKLREGVKKIVGVYNNHAEYLKAIFVILVSRGNQNCLFAAGDMSPYQFRCPGQVQSSDRLVMINTGTYFPVSLIIYRDRLCLIDYSGRLVLNQPALLAYNFPKVPSTDNFYQILDMPIVTHFGKFIQIIMTDRCIVALMEDGSVLGKFNAHIVGDEFPKVCLVDAEKVNPSFWVILFERDCDCTKKIVGITADDLHLIIEFEQHISEFEVRIITTQVSLTQYESGRETRVVVDDVSDESTGAFFNDTPVRSRHGSRYGSVCLLNDGRLMCNTAVFRHYGLLIQGYSTFAYSHHAESDVFICLDYDKARAYTLGASKDTYIYAKLIHTIYLYKHELKEMFELNIRPEWSANFKEKFDKFSVGHVETSQTKDWVHYIQKCTIYNQETDRFHTVIFVDQIETEVVRVVQPKVLGVEMMDSSLLVLLDNNKIRLYPNRSAHYLTALRENPASRNTTVLLKLTRDLGQHDPALLHLLTKYETANQALPRYLEWDTLPASDIFARLYKSHQTVEPRSIMLCRWGRVSFDEDNSLLAEGDRLCRLLGGQVQEGATAAAALAAPSAKRNMDFALLMKPSDRRIEMQCLENYIVILLEERDRANSFEQRILLVAGDFSRARLFHSIGLSGPPDGRFHKIFLGAGDACRAPLRVSLSAPASPARPVGAAPPAPASLPASPARPPAAVRPVSPAARPPSPPNPNESEA